MSIVSNAIYTSVHKYVACVEYFYKASALCISDLLHRACLSKTLSRNVYFIECVSHFF